MSGIALHGFRRRRGAAPAVRIVRIVLAVVLAAALAASLAGCGPKRVVRTAPAVPAPNGPAAAAPGSPGPQSGARGLQAAELARQQIGKSYRWGASGPDSFDCSGLVQYVYSNLGVHLPRESRRQAALGVPVARDALQPGDLVFFSLRGGGIDHVGIFIGGEEFVHAPRIHQPVGADSLNTAAWKNGFVAARRLP